MFDTFPDEFVAIGNASRVKEVLGIKATKMWSIYDKIGAYTQMIAPYWICQWLNMASVEIQNRSLSPNSENGIVTRFWMEDRNWQIYNHGSIYNFFAKQKDW